MMTDKPRKKTKEETPSLQTLLEEKRKKCDGGNKKFQREVIDPRKAITEPNAVWGRDMIPDGGTVMETSQASLIDAVIRKKKKEQDGSGLLGKLLSVGSERLLLPGISDSVFCSSSASDDGSSIDIQSNSSNINNCDDNNDNRGGGKEESLFTREIMFSIREDKRMDEERQRVLKSQEEARKILEREQAEKASLVSSLASAVSF